jgi:hypothetical protein
VLKNCIIYGNQAVAGFENHYDSYMAYCCTTPLPLDGIRNFSNDPLFINPSGNDFHLQPDSPCINAGKNAISGILDFEGNLRIIGGTVDVGAYEFPSPRSAISYAWLQEYSLATDGSADYTDPDGDGLNCWQEWRCLTVPTNELSALRMRSVARTGTDVVISWDSVPGIRYCLERSTNYLGGFAFHALATNLWPQSAIGSYTNTNAAAISPLFYRVTVVD